jgi:hypothetical protein
MDRLRPEQAAALLDQHARLMRFVFAYAFGEDAGEAAGT